MLAHTTLTPESGVKSGAKPKRTARSPKRSRNKP
jgi:hypothetical protein